MTVALTIIRLRRCCPQVPPTPSASRNAGGAALRGRVPPMDSTTHLRS